jgi:hypothetical protein
MFQINWKLKSLLYNIFGFFKLKKTVYLTQKYVTKRSKINIDSINKIWKFHSDAIESNDIKHLLEVGAGKSLEQNIYLSYFFKNKIHQTAIDIDKMLDFELLNEASLQISKVLKLKFPGKIDNLNNLSSTYNIEYIAPQSTKDLIKKDSKFDICLSSTALEHFTKKDLGTYLKEVKKLIKKFGLISSVIDYSDHYSHTDSTISPLNFLKFNDKQWERHNNLFLYQNRFRHKDYVNLFKEFQYEIVQEVKGEIMDPPDKLDSSFQISNKDNFILWGYFLVKNL